MIHNIIIILFTLSALITIFFINKFRLLISQKTNLIDTPNKIRKFHIKETPLLGGLMIFSTFFLINIYFIFSDTFNRIDGIVFIISTLCFFLGLFDDCSKLNYKYKFFFLTFFFAFFLCLEPSLVIDKVYFVTYDKYIHFGNYNIFFTTLCLILLVNAINLIDGINGLCILIIVIILTCLIFFFTKINLLYVILIISLFYIFFLNLKNYIFLGDSGSLFLGSLIGLELIYNYNNKLLVTNYPVENIFIILMMPGFDMFRVFILRILKRKSPFTPDRLHLHHLLFDKSLKLSTIIAIYLFLILIPICMNSFEIFSPIQIIFGYLVVYVSIIFLTNKIK